MVKTEEFIPTCTYNILCKKNQNSLKDILIADVHFLMSLLVIINTDKAFRKDRSKQVLFDSIQYFTNHGFYKNT